MWLAGYCRFEEYCAFIHRPANRVLDVLDLLEDFDRKHFFQLRDLLPKETQHTMARLFSPFLSQWKGWEEKDFEVGDKKSLKKKLTAVKSKMANSKYTSQYATKLRYLDEKSGSLQGNPMHFCCFFDSSN